MNSINDHFLICIAHLRFESQTTLFDNCRRRGGLSHYRPAVYSRDDIGFSNLEQPVCWTLNASAATVQYMGVNHRGVPKTRSKRSSRSNRSTRFEKKYLQPTSRLEVF